MATTFDKSVGGAYGAGAGINLAVSPFHSRNKARTVPSERNNRSVPPSPAIATALVRPGTTKVPREFHLRTVPSDRSASGSQPSAPIPSTFDRSGGAPRQQPNPQVE